MIRVFLADDHPVVTEGVARFLDAEEDIQVVGRRRSAVGLSEAFVGAEADVLVLDLDMPGMFGAETVKLLAAEGINIVVFSLYAEGPLAGELQLAGARAFVSKSRELTDLATAVRRVHAGERVALPASAAPHLALSQREREIFDDIVGGKALKVIALDLGLSSSTVHTYARRIRLKLGAETIADLIRYAHRAGLRSRPS